MPYRVEFTTAAARQLRKLERTESRRLLAIIESLADEPRPHGSLKLSGEATAWRIRSGSYRIIYDILDDVLVVTVVRVGHRRDVYESR